MNKKILTTVSILILISFSCIVCLKTAKAENNITINYSISNPTGTNYIVVNMTIKNNGYSSFPVFYGDFQMNESGGTQNIQNPLTAMAYLDTLPSENLNNGDTFSGSLVYYGFPSDGAQYTLSYSEGSAITVTQNIVWNQVSSPSDLGLSTSNPTSSTTVSTPAAPEFPTLAILAAFLALSLFTVALLSLKKRNVDKS
jgi:hypothetical protein